MKRWAHLFSVRNIVVFVVILCAVGYVAYTVVQNGSPTEEVLTVAQQEFVQSVSVSGKVEAVKDVDLGFAQGGRVGRVLATVGSRVEQGSVLAETENGDIVALVQQREASLQVAEAELASLLVGTRKEEIAVAEADVRAKNIALEQAALSLIDEVQGVMRARLPRLATTLHVAVPAQQYRRFQFPPTQSPALLVSQLSRAPYLLAHPAQSRGRHLLPPQPYLTLTLTVQILAVRP
jgi:multidrug efflux pump subunit AcrA (membrane-fusion protein)